MTRISVGAFCSAVFCLEESEGAGMATDPDRNEVRTPWEGKVHGQLGQEGEAGLWGL